MGDWLNWTRFSDRWYLIVGFCRLVVVSSGRNPLLVGVVVGSRVVVPVVPASCKVDRRQSSVGVCSGRWRTKESNTLDRMFMLIEKLHVLQRFHEWQSAVGAMVTFHLDLSKCLAMLSIPSRRYMCLVGYMYVEVIGIVSLHRKYLPVASSSAAR